MSLHKNSRAFAASLALVIGATLSACEPSMNPDPGDAGSGDAAGPAPGDGGGPAPSDAAAALRTIPTTMIKAADGQTFVTVQLSVGNSPPFTAFVDTGSVGLRILDGVVALGDWSVTSQTTPTYGYGSGTQLDGVVAMATLTIGSVRSAAPIAVEAVTAVGCSASKPTCNAAGKTPSTYRFAGTFPAILGVGMRASPNSTKVGSPLALLAKSGSFVISLGQGDSGAIRLDPSDVARFDNVVKLPSKGASILPQYASYDDTQIPFCANAFCGLTLFDTGAPSSSMTATTSAELMNLGVPAASTKVPTGTSLRFTVNQRAAFTFSAGSPTITLGRTGSYSNLGQLPYRYLDVLYDHANGLIAVAPPL